MACSEEEYSDGEEAPHPPEAEEGQRDDFCACPEEKKAKDPESLRANASAEVVENTSFGDFIELPDDIAVSIVPGRSTTLRGVRHMTAVTRLIQKSSLEVASLPVQHAMNE